MTVQLIEFRRFRNSACYRVSHNALFRTSQTHSGNDSISDFDWVFLEIPVKNCIVGMLLTCPIACVIDSFQIISYFGHKHHGVFPVLKGKYHLMGIYASFRQKQWNSSIVFGHWIRIHKTKWGLAGDIIYANFNLD